MCSVLEYLRGRTLIAVEIKDLLTETILFNLVALGAILVYVPKTRQSTKLSLVSVCRFLGSMHSIMK